MTGDGSPGTEAKTAADAARKSAAAFSLWLVIAMLAGALSASLAAIEGGNALERAGPYVVPGDDPEQPRHDLKRPWDAVTKQADLVGVRLHDLRHTYASFGAGGGLGLPIIGRLLGHAQAATTARYSIWTMIHCGVHQRQLPDV